jgi:hypothetical protein
MLYNKIIAVCTQIHTRHINTLCGQNVELVNVKRGGTYSNHWALKGLIKHSRTTRDQKILICVNTVIYFMAISFILKCIFLIQHVHESSACEDQLSQTRIWFLPFIYVLNMTNNLWSEFIKDQVHYHQN